MMQHFHIDKENERANELHCRAQYGGQMKKYNYLDEVLVDSLKQQPLNLNYTPESHREGLATYFREFLRAHMKTWINNENNVCVTFWKKCYLMT